MSGNMESDRSVTTGKMYPIDLAPQKITIVKNVTNNEVKMAHLISGQTKTSGSNPILGHSNASSTVMRPGLAQIIAPNVVSQPHMILSGSPILQGTQIVSQGSQILGQNSQIISQSQLITPSGQIISPATQIISQGTQLSAPASTSNNASVQNTIQTNVASSVSGAQVLNVGQLVTGAGNVVVNSSVRTLPPTVRVIPPSTHHNTRPAVQLSSVSNSGGVLVTKTVSTTSHVPRGLAAGASLAVRPVAPPVSQSSGLVNSGSTWSNTNRTARSALVYATRPSTPAPASLSTILTIPTTSTLNSSGVISSTVRGLSPRLPTASPTSAGPPPRPLPLLQRNYQPAKVVGVASVGVRGVVGNSAPTQLYYEVPRAPHPAHSPAPAANLTHPPVAATIASTGLGLTTNSAGLGHAGVTSTGLGHGGSAPASAGLSHAASAGLGHVATAATGLGHGGLTGLSLAANVASAPMGGLAHALTAHVHRPLTPYAQSHTHPSVNQVNSSSALPETRRSPALLSSNSTTSITAQPRPSILRKRDLESSPIKPISIVQTSAYNTGTGWEDVPAGGGGSGSTTISASSSPHPDDEPEPPPIDSDLSPRKKPRKQTLTNDVRHCDYQNDEQPSSPPQITIKTPKRPQLGSSYVCGWRGTALHFVRPSDVKRREPRPRDITAIAAQRHVLATADGWKLHHLTAQMDDLVSLESDVGEQLSVLLRGLESAPMRALSALQPHEHPLLELLKGNIQRSKIVCEGIQEARADILRVFTHRKFVSEILTRQADKRCFRKHRSQS
ncbi:mucin-5AC isoform X1 [Bombyx mandarina]|uniref:Mucin-5AC isoform X1 n=1 Tax=Bombyx mandarina TaxID=7092 RepID=A0A6J2JCF2_BOMMA|nr:mucin-5AC isoform X1 [Bombyx mandarina]